ncbi:MAG TPA: ABC transporter permease [Gemmataceae bacterium]|nr:ABC transporter permease [Gemmataceae bacterium]
MIGLLPFIVLPLFILAILVPFFLVLGGSELAARGTSLAAESTGVFGLAGKAAAFVLAVPKFGVMMFMNLRRSLLRTSLTYLATFAGVIVVAMIWSVLSFLDNVMTEKSKDVKAIVTEKFQIPSQMPPSYENGLSAEAVALPEGLRADRKKDLMSWTFLGGSTDPDKRTLETIVFFFCLPPDSLLTMMDDLDESTIGHADRAELEQNVATMKANIPAVILGQDRLKAINKKVGDRIKVYSFNYKDIDFEVEIIGTFPRGRYDNSAAMNIDYFRRKLDAYERSTGQRHAMADKSLNLFWARFPQTEGFEQYAERAGRPGLFSSPAVKVEKSSAAVASFLDAYKDILWGMRALMAPLIVGVIVLIVAIANSISVRERQKEMAIMKVLGFAPWQILVLIMGEAILIGVLSGAIATTSAWYLINVQFGGFALPIAFFGKFKVADAALWWGPAVGAFAGAAGSFLPAWSARKVKVTEVFSRIA